MVTDHRRKIRTLDSLQSALAAHKARGQIIVHCHGCFDIVHPGHIQYLQFARRQGHVLLVSVTGDSEINKSDQRPYVPQELRAESLAALEFVDYVYIDSNDSAVELLGTIQPDIYVKGKEYETNGHPGFLEERKTVENYGGRVLFSSGDVVFSSTELLAQMQDSPPPTLQRLRPICQRHDITRSRLEELLASFTGKRVLIVGDAIQDRYVFCDAMDMASEAPILSLSRMTERTFVGGAAILARHARAMGASAALITAGADDAASERLAETMRDERIAIHMVHCGEALPEKTRYLVEDTKVLKVESGERQPLDSTTERTVAGLVTDQAGCVDAVIFCDFGFGMITAGLLDRTVPALRNRARVLAADTSGARGNLRRFQGFDLLSPTEREMRLAMNDFSQGLSSVSWKLMEKTQIPHMFVTLSKRGFVAFERQSSDRSSSAWRARLRSEHLPAFDVHSLDSLGCGDAFLSAAVLALTCGANMMQAGYLGSVAAAIEVGILGNEPVDRQAMRQFLQWRAELQAEHEVERRAAGTA